MENIIEIGEVKEDQSVIGIREFTKYSDAEEQFLLPADSKF